MAKKQAVNKYGVQVGDIFAQNFYTEDSDTYYFFQVIALRGQTQVVVKETESKIIAFDGKYVELVPNPGEWIFGREKELIRRVNPAGKGRVEIVVEGGMRGSAYLEKGKRYLAKGLAAYWSHWLENSKRPELAEQLDLKKGSGIFAVDGFFGSKIKTDSRAVIRYPDGREEEIFLKDLFE